MNNHDYTDPKRRHDFVLLFDVTDGNPNGDPDAGNLPRVDPETMQGLVTDVCLKRKVRNYVLIAKIENGKLPEGYDIYVKERAILNQLHQHAYDANNIEVGQPSEATIPPKLMDVFVMEDEPATLPEGFLLESGEEDNSWILKYSGLLDSKEKKDALDEIEESLGKEAKKFCSDLAKKAKSRKPKREEIDTAQNWMSKTFFDVRTFGAVMSTGVNCGQIRGPVQMTFARSIDPIVPMDISITRVAITREEDADRKETEMGRKAFLPYGLYRCHGFFTPHFAKDTGVNGEDLRIFWQALQNMWDIDHSSSRGMMACRGLYVFTHENALGNAPAHALFDLISVRKKDGIQAPRQFQDYEVTVNDSELPEGVSLHRLVE